MIELLQTQHAAGIHTVHTGDIHCKYCMHSGTCRQIDSIMPMSQAAYNAHTLWLQEVHFPSEADGYQIFQVITPF